MKKRLYKMAAKWFAWKRKKIEKMNEDFINRQLNDEEFRKEIHRKYR